MSSNPPAGRVAQLMKSTRCWSRTIAKATIEGVAFIHKPANKEIVLKSLGRNLAIEQAGPMEKAYQGLVAELPRKPCPTMEGMNAVIKLMAQHGLNAESCAGESRRQLGFQLLQDNLRTVGFSKVCTEADPWSDGVVECWNDGSETVLSAEEFIAEIWQERRRFVREGRIKQPHPWRVALSQGKVSRHALIEYVKNRYYFLANINRKDAQVIANCPDLRRAAHAAAKIY